MGVCRGANRASAALCKAANAIPRASARHPILSQKDLRKTAGLFHVSFFIRVAIQPADNPSVSFADSSLCTREPSHCASLPPLCKGRWRAAPERLYALCALRSALCANAASLRPRVLKLQYSKTPADVGAGTAHFQTLNSRRSAKQGIGGPSARAIPLAARRSVVGAGTARPRHTALFFAIACHFPE